MARKPRRVGHNKMAGYRGVINKKSWLRQLAVNIAIDNRGNTLAIMGAAVIPVLALMGSGIDMSRGYMAKARLQQACDSGALAGRAAMTSVTFTDTAKAQANKYFDFNYPSTIFGSTQITRTYTADSEGQVNGVASARIATTVMKAVGIKTLDIVADCKAKLDFVNTDIVLVLDTTGSMGSNKVSTGETRLEALKSAVFDLYDTLEPIGKNLYNRNLRLRYGIVPYSSNANVGKLLYARNKDFIRLPYNYYQCSKRSSTPGQCTAAAVKTTNSTTRLASWLSSTSWNGCVIARQTSNAITSTTTSIPSDAKDLDIALIPVKTDTTTQWSPHDPELDTSWETQSTTALTKSFTSCPSSAVDLKEYYDASGSTAERDKFRAAITALEASGGTYHDVGMIWGAQMIAPEQGVFNVPLPGETGTNRNPASYNNIAVNKHLIFMTDGVMDTTGVSIDRYTMYGAERYSKATYTGTSDTELVARHKKRFSLMCEAVKKMGVQIWVVQFEEGTDDSTLVACASDASHFSKVNGKSDLSSEFIKIGKAIGALRITK